MKDWLYCICLLFMAAVHSPAVVMKRSLPASEAVTVARARVTHAADRLRHGSTLQQAVVAVGGAAQMAGIPDFHRTISGHAQPGVCNAMKLRHFSFQDANCGTQALNFTVEDTLKAHKVEQAYWNNVGRHDPWWSVLIGYDRGSIITKAAQLNFYQSGLEWVENMLQLTRKHGLNGFLDTVRNGTALDLGCGVGRMANALVKFGFRDVLCVDQSSDFLQRASSSLDALAGQGVILPDILKSIRFVESGPDLLCSIMPGTIDFSHSVITLQHMKPMLQVAYIEQLCDVLRPGGYGFFQIPVELKASRGQHCNISTETFGMAMHYTPTSEITRHLQDRGCKVLAVADSDLLHGIGAGGKSKSIAFQKQ